MCIGAAGGCAASCAASICTSLTCKMCGSLGKTVSMATRLTYGLLLLMGAALAVFVRQDFMQTAMADLSHHFWCDEKSIWCPKQPDGTVPKVPAEMYGKYGVYRVMSGVAMFHFVLALLLIKVKNSSDTRAKLNNNLWCVKLVLWFGFVLVNFFLVPVSFFTGSAASIMKVGACIFIFIQTGHLVSFSYFVCDKLIDQAEKDVSEQMGCGPFYCNCWNLIILIGTLVGYSFHLFVLVYAIALYTAHNACNAALWGACVGFLLMIVTSSLSVSNLVRDAPNGQGYANGVAQSSIVAAYTSYLVLSAMVNNPNQQCRPFHTDQSGSTTMQILGLVIAFVSVLWSAIRMGSSSKVADGNGSAASESLIGGDADGDDSIVEAAAHDDDETECTYSYTNFHLTFAFAAMYLCMLLTQWGSIDGDSLDIVESRESVWIKVVASWCCFLLYIWVLLAPPACPNRDFTGENNA